MKFTVIDKKVQISNETKEFAEHKIGKIDRFFKGDSEAFVTFSYERGRYRAEVTIENDGTFYRASEMSSDLRACVDAACATIERQIRKNKTRLEKRLRDGAFEREIGEDTYFEPEEKDFDIVRNKRFPIKNMTTDEAILQMNLLEHQFFAFKNEDEGGSFSVVYRRHNGGYGLICDVK